MTEQDPQDTNDIYLAPKVMAAMTVMELGGLGLANLVTDVSETYNHILLTTAGAATVGAAIGTVAAYAFSKK